MPLQTLLTTGLALVTIRMSRVQVLDQEVQAELMVDELITEDEEGGDDDEVEE